MVTRRVFLTAALASATLPLLDTYGSIKIANQKIATDEAYWAGIRKLYDLNPDIINVESRNILLENNWETSEEEWCLFSPEFTTLY